MRRQLVKMREKERGTVISILYALALALPKFANNGGGANILSAPSTMHSSPFTSKLSVVDECVIQKVGCGM